MPKSAQRYFEFKIDKALRHVLEAEGEEVAETELMHNLLQEDALRVTTFFHGLQNSPELNQVNQLADKLKDIDIKLQRLSQANIRSGGANEDVRQLFSQRDELNQKLGSLKTRVEDLRQKIAINEKNLEVARRESTNWLKKTDASKKQRIEIEYCEKLMSAVKDYQHQLLISKTNRLEREILWMWSQLTHKPELVDRIVVSPDEKFEVKMFNAQDTEIDKTKLSAGEKEIYAISLLWALVVVSGKNLPIIIDTPFGRLDSLHRQKLVTNYFPSASHQVFLLSQDEEIVGNYYDAIRPHLAREITLENVEGETFFSEGYPFSNFKQLEKLQSA